ncbi:membrane protein insertion efficiency factor YidD [Rathayibacter agropyri]|uniref:membrane protein insertion efficiency factor YidD n=1 Tax=Rathayibacter agropyri TaxID=1634927 RepID=UPI001565D77B|nr:membrane protein insertion efficiency factor YidD [Rathayibacter agropyri]NRD09232.1 membrane protein insertion efficiency factor YidD [Rathayibacter agropyri]
MTAVLPSASSWPTRLAWGVLLLPRNIGILLLLVYRRVISPLYGEVCRYYPSCSAYALQAVQLHGLVLGSVLATRRLLRCHPWAAGGVDDVPTSIPLHRPAPGRIRFAVTRAGFVVGPRKD